MKSDLDYIKHIHDEILFSREEFIKTIKNSFLENNVLKRAFVRSIEIIGEASNKLSESFRKKYPEPEWRKFSATRNHLIHGYFIIDYDIFRYLVENKIPQLYRNTCFAKLPKSKYTECAEEALNGYFPILFSLSLKYG